MGVIFTCLVIRAIHIEVIHEMSSSSFINALRRLIALRGDVKLIRSDCGTNFVGAAKELRADVVDIEGTQMKDSLAQKRITWRFNPPHASHMGGVWERMIGVSRRILDSLLRDHKHLTDEVVITLMAEVCPIVNARPIAGIPSDPYTPVPLSPAKLLLLRIFTLLMRSTWKTSRRKTCTRSSGDVCRNFLIVFGNVGKMSILRNSNTGGNGKKSSAIFAKVM